MSKPRRSLAVVFDLEYTAWEGSVERRWSLPGEKMEVVQFGAVKLDAVNLAPIDEFEMLVRPRVNPVLSEYLVALTGISNDVISKCALDFVTAYRAFLDFVGEAPVWAFGRDDAILAYNLKLYGWGDALPVPFCHDTIPWFIEQGIDVSGKHACDVAQLIGVDFEGHKHDALADARSVARGMAALIERGSENPFAPRQVSMRGSKQR